ncbi:MAG: NusG domain II-containing protein [Lachnospiraceae bacterium]|nr:NusG domain II-containing protein [Lachnospiraceae bacterium]
MSKKLKADVAVIAAIGIVATLFWAIPYLNGDLSETVIINQDGKIYREYPLYNDAVIPVYYEPGGYNLILVSEGEVSVTDADCPDKLCVKQRAVSKNGESIICLPHKLVVQISSKEESDLDAVTN